MKLTLEQIREKLSRNPSLRAVNPGFDPAGGVRGGTKSERAVGHGTVRPAPIEKENPIRCKVSVVSFRRRLLDPDNLCPKYHIDALRYAGVIADDTAKHLVFEVRQEKVNEKRSERTEITIERLT